MSTTTDELTWFAERVGELAEQVYIRHGIHLLSEVAITKSYAFICGVDGEALIRTSVGNVLVTTR